MRRVRERHRGPGPNRLFRKRVKSICEAHGIAPRFEGYDALIAAVIGKPMRVVVGRGTKAGLPVAKTRSCRRPPKTGEARVRRASQKGPGATLIVGFDSEYQRAGGGRNDVVCLSFAALDPDTGKLAAAPFPARRRTGAAARRRPARWRGPWWLRKTGVITRTPHRIVLAAHWSRADLPAFRDFSTLKRRFDSPGRRSPPPPSPRS